MNFWSDRLRVALPKSENEGQPQVVQAQNMNVCVLLREMRNIYRVFTSIIKMVVSGSQVEFERMLRKPTLPFFCQFSPTNSTTFEFYVELVSSSVESVASDNRYILSACHSVVTE